MIISKGTRFGAKTEQLLDALVSPLQDLLFLGERVVPLEVEEYKAPEEGVRQEHGETGQIGEELLSRQRMAHFSATNKSSYK